MLCFGALLITLAEFPLEAGSGLNGLAGPKLHIWAFG